MAPPDDEVNAEERFERAIRDSITARPDTALVEIREMSRKRALVVVEEDATVPSGTLYRISKESGPDREIDLHWELVGDMELD